MPPFVLVLIAFSAISGHPLLESQNDGQGRLKVDVYRLEGREKRSLLDQLDADSPVTLSIESSVGKQWLLDLEPSMDLISSRFVMRHFDALGREVLTREVPRCHFQGKLRSVDTSYAVVSTCGGINGVIYDGNRTFDIQPAENRHAGGPSHLLTPVADDSGGGEFCGVTGKKRSSHTQTDRKDSDHDHPHVAKRSVLYPYTVELTLVADNSLYQKTNENVTEIQITLTRFTNVVNDIYKRSGKGVHIALVSIEIWSQRDFSDVSSDFSLSLSNFNKYNGDTLQKNPLHKSDNSQLLTSVDFQGATKGFAGLSTMCNGRTSTAVVEILSLFGGSTGSVMAHEMGHNFGMQHDDDVSGCQCDDDQGCVMSSFLSGGQRNYIFSQCSADTLETALNKGQGACLINTPSKLYGPAVCGNGFVESGEDCDCGTADECRAAVDNCCNPLSCRLNLGAVCSDTGDGCCRNCQLAPRGMVCRSVAGDCDIEEKCTGVDRQCPSNVFERDGTNCTGSGQEAGLCYHAMCHTRTEQCLLFWGTEATDGSSGCYGANVNGKFYGHCGGSDPNYIACSDEDIFCGKLQCFSDLSQPTVTNRAWSSATYTVGQQVCRSISLKVEDDEMNPGLVRDGTKCGNGKICLSSKCVAVPVSSAASCPADGDGLVCSGQGVCTNVNTCACFDDYTGAICGGGGGGGNGGVIAAAIIVPLVIIIAIVLIAYLFPDKFFSPCPSLRPNCLKTKLEISNMERASKPAVTHSQRPPPAATKPLPKPAVPSAPSPRLPPASAKPKPPARPRPPPPTRPANA
eukprot:m.12800 g.12800  ORF g.12800 m.12800 type:complete len:797 (+) comp24295_c0_seq1:78-2468(+)